MFSSELESLKFIVTFFRIKNNFNRGTSDCYFCVSQITMTTGWLLLLLLVVSPQSVDSQSTTDDNEVCDGGQLRASKEDIKMLLDKQLHTILADSIATKDEMRRDKLMLLDNQQQVLQLLRQNKTAASHPGML